MDVQRATRLDQLLERVLDLPAPERQPWLEVECAADPSLIAEVERLLTHVETEVNDLLEPVQAFVAELGQEGTDGLAEGEVLGAYRIVGRLGRGGMGLVYLAERNDQSFERRVAVKVMPTARSSAAAVRRFEQERQILARLDHPSIARLLDGGVDERGLPYLVLELIEGEPIDRWCDERATALEQRLRLVIAIADGVQAAHQRLVVHRDLKPSNLLVTAAGDVKLLDFGIAKLLDAEETTPGLTAADGRPMTPTYASPEQVNAQPITTASDIYQLGLLLYELSTGLKPQAADTASLSELVELVCHHEPAPPSRAVLTGDDRHQRAARRGSTPERLSRRLRRDLDAIVGRALAKAPAERYDSAAALARDLERFLAGQAVEARGTPPAERLSKWVRRNPALAVAAGLLALTTVGYALAVTLQSRALERQRARAETEARKAAEVERFVLGLFESSDPEQALGRDVPASELLRRGRERVERELASQPEVQARLLSSLGSIYGEIGQLPEALELLEFAHDLQISLPGDHRLEIADTEQRLGQVLRQLRRLAEARTALERAVSAHRLLLGADSPEEARDLAELGGIASELGEIEVAAAHFAASLAIHRRRGNEGGIAIGLNNLASISSDRGDLEAAANLYREALTIQRRRFGDRHPRVALPLFNLGLTLRRLERIPEALPLLEEAWSIHREVYGERHLTTLLTQTQLASVLTMAEEHDRADALLAAALGDLRAQVPGDDRRLTTAEIWQGYLRLKQGRFREAKAVLTSALARRAPPQRRSDPLARQAEQWLEQAIAGAGRAP